MKEIHPRYGNLSIYMNNHYCGAATATARCPRALSVHYNSMEVILTSSAGARGQGSLVSGPVPGPPGKACRPGGQLPRARRDASGT